MRIIFRLSDMTGVEIPFHGTKEDLPADGWGEPVDRKGFFALAEKAEYLTEITYVTPYTRGGRKIIKDPHERWELLGRIAISLCDGRCPAILE